MTKIQILQTHVCILFVSFGLLTFYLSMKDPILVPDKKTFTNKNLKKNDHENQSVISFNNDTDYFYFNPTINESLLEVSNDLKNSEKTNVNILGLFELSTQFGERKESQSEILTAKIAIERINKMNILPGFTLNLLINDTKCDPGVGIDRFFHALYSKKNILILLGSGCSNVSESLANVVPYWNIPQISYGSKSPQLSDRNKFPLFFRTIAPDSSHYRAKIQFIKHFQWKVVAAFAQSESYHLLPINNLVKQLEIVNISCVATLTISEENYKDQLKTLKSLGVRIILGSLSNKLAGKVFCEVFHLGMYGQDYVWILQDQQYDFLWQNYGCDVGYLIRAAEGLVLISNVDSIASNETSDSGLTLEELNEELSILNSTKSEFITYIYDAVWATAYSLHGDGLISCSYSKYSYNKRREEVKQFMRNMENLNFLGLSGPVRFSGSDRIGNTRISQIQGEKTIYCINLIGTFYKLEISEGRIAKIGVYDSSKDKLDFDCADCFDVLWRNKIPVDQRIIKIVTLKVPKILYFAICIISVLGILASISFFVFIVKFQSVKCLKLTSPKLNNVAVFGCILVYTSVISMEIDTVIKISEKFYSVFCTAKTFLLSSGFSLIFGSMFAKTYRVHKLFNDRRTISVVKTKLLKDTHLIGLILTPIVIDALILTLWVVVDPMKRILHNFTTNVNPMNGVVFQTQVELCGSNNTVGWYFALYGYKCLVLIMGVFMAWENRRVKIPTLNDIQYIGVSVYCVVFSFISLILSNFIEEYLVLSYLCGSCTILTATSIILILLFLPQFRMVLGKTENDEKLMEIMGLKIECNTRRFIYKDQRELFDRLEIQNRVFRNELKNLDAEIEYLENLLNKPVESSDTNSSSSSTGIYTISKQRNRESQSCGRASWPTNYQTIEVAAVAARFSSDNKLNENFFDKFKIIGRLKKFLGSFTSIDYSNPVNIETDSKVAEEYFSNDEEELKVIDDAIVYHV